MRTYLPGNHQVEDMLQPGDLQLTMPDVLVGMQELQLSTGGGGTGDGESAHALTSWSGFPPVLRAYAELFDEEELTPEILGSFSRANLISCMTELGISEEHASLLFVHLSANRDVAVAHPTAAACPSADAPISATAPPTAADPPAELSPRGALQTPRNWPASASAAKPVLKKLGARVVRLVGPLSNEHAALIRGVKLDVRDSHSTALAVHARTGWAIRGGYMLLEAVPNRSAGASELEDTANATYVGQPHVWNVTARGLWVDCTRSHDHEPQAVLVESAQTAPPTPLYASPKALAPLVIWAVEGLNNRLRAVLSHRVVAHAEGRPLVVVWRRDDFCNGHFLDCFEPIAGVRFVKEAPADAPRPQRTSETHPKLKNTLDECYSYAPLLPSDAVRATVAERLRACGRPFISLHVRRTDHLTAISAADQTGDDRFAAFVRRHAPKPVYIATDNAMTQRELVQDCGSRARIGNEIIPSGSVRQTPLRDAVADMFTCVASDTFAGSHGSSFSDAIAHLRRVGGTSSAEDEHVIMK